MLKRLFYNGLEATAVTAVGATCHGGAANLLKRAAAEGGSRDLDFSS